MTNTTTIQPTQTLSELNEEYDFLSTLRDDNRQLIKSITKVNTEYPSKDLESALLQCGLTTHYINEQIDEVITQQSYYWNKAKGATQ